MSAILIVDDNEQNRYLLRALLTASGYDVLEATNGVEALEQARRTRPDLIIADILMPQMDGFTLCRECKRDETLRDIPFVFYTATYTDPRDEALAMQLGAARFIVKPIDNEVFIAILREVLQAHQAGQLVAPQPPLEEETVYYRLYNEALIRKLEDKMLDLEQVNRRLAESEARFRRLAENAQDLIYRYEFTPRRGFTYVNPAATAITGYTPEEHYADPDLGLKLVHPDDRPLLERYLQGGGTFYEPVVLRWVRKDGQIVWTEQRNVPIYDEAGTLVAIEGIARDVTEQVRMREALARREAELRTTLYSIGDAVIATDVEGRVARMNPVAERLTGWSEAEAAGRPLEEIFCIVNEETRRTVENPVARVLRDGIVVGLANHTLLIARDGTEYPIADCGAPIRDERGHITGVVLVFRDQSEERRAQRAVEEARAFAESIVATVREPLVVLDADLRVVSANRAFYRVVQVTPEETQGCLLYDLGNRQWDIPELRRLLEDILPQNTSFDDYEVTCDFEQIGRRTMLLNARRLYREATKTQMILLAIEDITERKRSEEHIRYQASLLENVSDAIVATDAQFVIRSWNRGAEALYGWTAQEAIGRVMGDLVPTGYPNDRREDVLRQFRADGYWKGEVIQKCKDGTSRYILASVVALKDSDGNPIGAVAVNRDITERKQAEQALERRAAQMALLNDIGSKIAAVTDLGSVLERAAHLVQETFGYHHVALFTLDQERSDLVMRSRAGAFAHLFPPEHRIKLDEGVVGWVGLHGETLLANDVDAEPRYINFYPDVLPTRSELSVPIRIGAESVGVLDVQSDRRDAFDENDVLVLETLANQIAVAVENARLYQELRRHADELEQRVQERTAQLHSQYARLEAILNSTSDGILVTGSRGQILLTNPIAQTWLTQTLPAEDVERLQEVVRDLALRAGERPEGMLELAGLDLQLSAAPITEPGVEGARAVVAVHDVSQLKALDRLKSQFVSNVSHELRTPITTIKLYVALLRRSRPDKWPEYLDALAQEADRQARLVEDVLQISRIDAGRLELKLQPVNLTELAEAVTASHQTLACSKGLLLECRSAKPGPAVMADPERLMQVLNNLVENAIYYTPQGRVEVVTSQAEMEGKERAAICVSDTGMGIAEEELPHIFERFYRGERPQQAGVPGSGLGLAIAKEIVELHGGRITVESQVGIGSAFTVWLPLIEE